MLPATLVSGLTLLSCDRPDHINRNQHSNGAPFGFQCCFLVNQGRTVTKTRSISKAKIDNCQLHRSLQNCVICIALGGQNLKPQMHVCGFIPAQKICNPVGSLTRQDTGPGWQLSSSTDCLTLLKTRALCHPLARLGAGLSRQLW